MLLDLKIADYSDEIARKAMDGTADPASTRIHIDLALISDICIGET